MPARRRPRVALVSYDFGEYCVPLANALSRTTSVLLVLPRRELEPVARELDPAVHVVPFVKPRLRQPLRQALVSRRIVAAVRRFAPDLVHLQQGHLWFNVLGLPLLGDRPLVVTIHDHTAHLGDRGGRKTPQAVTNLAFRRADEVIVHAQRLRDEVVDLRGLEHARVHVIPHVALAPQPASTDAADGMTVLFFGRIWPYKGLEHLIRAEPLITARVPSARFVIAGEGERFDRYRAMMLDPSRFTVLNGFIPNAQRAELFARAAVVVLPYVEASQSGVVPVAYAAGKPVVATSVGGLPEVVEDGRTGLLVPPGDHRALADAIASLLEDPAARDDMGSAGRRKLEREWSPQVVAEQTLHVYEKALSEQAPSATGERDCQSAALRLHRHLLGASWRGDGLVGPDSGIRFNYRVGRFVKSYVPALSWSDDLYYMQTQGYWILGTGQVRDITGDERLDAVVAATARGVVARQRPEGAWGYPNPEWRGRVATVEGSWAAIGLLDAYRRTGDPEFLEAAIRWHHFLEEEIGYQAVRGGLAVNYFAGGEQTLAVPNNSALVLRVLAELTDASGDPRFLRRAPDLVRFLTEAQLPTGEMPYALGMDGIAGRRHFQCAQYNAFQCLDVIRYVQLTGDQQAAGLATTMAGFLRTRVRPDGSVAYACDKGVPRVAYHGAAVAAALHQGARLGEADCAEPRDRACARLLALQRDDGAFPHSRRDYGVLRDDRAYPRNLAMILHHLLVLDDVPLGQGHRRESEALA